MTDFLPKPESEAGNLDPPELAQWKRYNASTTDITPEFQHWLEQYILVQVVPQIPAKQLQGWALKTEDLWREVAMTQFTSNVTTTSTTEGTATQVVSSGAQEYTTEPVVIEFFSPTVSNTDSGANTTLTLFNGATPVGIIGKFYYSANAAYAAVRTTPGAGTHTFLIKAHCSTGTTTVAAGSGGSATNMPGYIRITQRGQIAYR